MECPPPEQLCELVEQCLTPEEAEAVRQHIDRCEACRVATARLVETTHAEEDAVPAYDLGGTLVGGRYRVVGRLGAGGMAVVYAARDERLERSVAVKVIRAVRRPGAADRLAQRLVRESKAMARLRHPNVVTVHDVGMHAGQVFVVAELVEGANLRAWLALEKRAWPEVLDVFRQAGAGLAAAHGVGLVHRDFKLDNVLVDRDARALITDFGLAQAVGEVARTTESDEPSVEVEDSTDLRLTDTGAVVGTPAYMAPEQYDGADVDARADVFSFCASLFEALHGKRPFAGTTAAQVQRARLEGSVEPPPDDAAIPRWLHDAVMAGLVPQIDRRPASMDAMLELLREPRRGRRWWWAAAVGMATAGVAVAVAVWPNAQASAPGCGGDDPLETLWDDGRRARLAGLGHIGWPGAEQRIDAYVADWRAAWAEVCTEPSGEAVSPEAELQRACLRARLPQFDAELLALEDGRVPVQEVLRRLAEPRSCMQEPGTALLPVPSELQMRERVEQLREQIVYLQAEQRAGRMSEISEKIGTVLASAREIGFRPVLAESLYLAGTNEAFVGQPQRAHPLLFEAANHATASGHDTIAAEAWLFLVNVSAADLGDVRRGHEYASQAWAALDRLGEAPIRREIELRLRLNEAELLLTDSNYPAMHEQIDQAEVLARDHDPDALDRVWELRALAYQSTDRVQEAVASHRRVLALRQERMGRLHPNTFVAMLNLSGALVEGGSRKEGLAYANAAVAAASDVFPADSLMLAELRINLAEAWRGVGKPEQSLEVASQARQALGVVDDTNERLSAYIELVVGAALTDLGRDEESVVATRRALETASHIDARGTLSAFARVHLVESLRVTGNLVEAERVGREAVAFEVAREPSDPWMLAMAEHVLGAVLLDTGDVAEAERRLTVAVDSLTSRETDRDMRVPAMASLARARWLLGDRTSATELARQAWEMLVRDPSGGRERAALEDWARSHKVNLEE